MTSENVRCFVAVELPGDLKVMLDSLQERLKSSGCSCARWVRPEGIHLTLKFLGDIPLNRTAEVTGAIEESVRGIAPMNLKIAGLGVFPNPRAVRVAWVGIGGEVDKLRVLQSKVDAGLDRIGFAAEERLFTPHLTIARVNKYVSTEERGRFGRIITGADFPPFTFQVSSVSLMQSRLEKKGAIYSRISSTVLE